LQRRQLNVVQRVQLALQKKPILEEIGKLNKSLAGKNYGWGRKKYSLASSVQTCTKLSSVGRVDNVIAKDAGVSARQVAKIEMILDRAAEQLKSKVLAGTISVDGAYKEVRDEMWRIQQLADTEKLCCSFLEADHKCQLFEGDFRISSKNIVTGSVSLIFTDPPYDRKSLHLYKDLVDVAFRVLKPGGSLITYIGQYALFEIGNVLLESGLTYWWEFCIQLEGPFARYFDRQLVVNWKPLLWLVKGSRPINPSFPRSGTGKKNFMHDLIISKTPDKRFHKWGQSTAEAEYCIKFLTAENDLVLDPFLGEGTTALACMKLSRRFVGIDIDPKAIEFTRANRRLGIEQRE
jgi:hypothetical protein